MNLSGQYWTLLKSVLSLTLMLSLQARYVHADEQPQNKTTFEKFKLETKTGDSGQKQPRKLNENLKRLDPKNKLPVEPIIAEMKRAGKLIENRQTGKETQKLQQQVVQNLEKLIQQIESAPRSAMKQASQNKNQESMDKKKARQQKSGAGQKNAPRPSQGPARQSSERKEKGEATAGQLDNGNVYIKDAWGHLPPAMRQQLLNIYSEKFLPQYENHVRRYYEALAEQKKRSP